MISGVGSMMLGSPGFVSDILSICTSSFSLDFQYENYGYSYLSSSQKMMLPAADNFDAKQKSWTISLDFATMSKPIWEALGETAETDIDNYYTVSVYGNQSPVPVPSSIGVPSSYSLYNQTTRQVMTFSSSPSGTNQYGTNLAGDIIFPSSVSSHLICIFVIGESTSYDIQFISNKKFSYSGLIYSTDSTETLGLYCPSIQIESYPSFSVGSSQPISFNCLDEIKIFKLY